MKHVMLDLETMGMRSGCAIVAIGAVYFDIEKGTLGDEFYNTIDLRSNRFLSIDADTVLWWLAQNEAARAEIVGARTSIYDALTRFSSFFEADALLWAHGASFDPPILEAAYVGYNDRAPWKYSNVRDTRTIYELANVYPDRNTGTHHNALDDAKNQARAVMEAHKWIINLAMADLTQPEKER